MRLSYFQQQVIHKHILANFGDGSKVRLFGSRADDAKFGGDIDLYIETNIIDSNLVQMAKTKAYIGICTEIGEQKIDMVVHINGSNYAPIEQIAKETGVEI